MADFDIDGARKAGYSDAEIADFLGEQKGFDTKAAMKAGYAPSELVAHLSKLAPPAGGGRGSVNPPAVQPAGADTTASDDAMRAGDPMGIVAQEQYKAPERAGSVFDDQDIGGPRMDAPTNDASVNERALDNARKSNPAIDKSPMYSTGVALEKSRALVDKGAVAQEKTDAEANRTSGSTLKDVALNLVGGIGQTVNKTGAVVAQLTGSENAEEAFDTAAEHWKKVQAENGGGTIPGKVAGFVGAVAPAAVAGAMLPATEAWMLVTNAGLFAVPAFRDTLKEKLAAGQDFPLALAHASQSFGLNLFLPSIASKGGALVNSAAGRGIIGNAASAAAEGAGFSAATTVLDKGTDLVAGEKNQKDWIDFADMGTMALGFGAMRGIHAGGVAVGKGVEAVRDRMGTPSEQFGRALGKDVEGADFAPVQPANLNPNLKDAQRDPVAAIFSTGSVEDAVAQAQKAAGLDDPGDIAAEMNAARPIRPKAEPIPEPVGDTAPEGELDVRAPADVPGVPAEADGGRGDLGLRGVDDAVGTGGAGLDSRVDTPSGERAPEAGDARMEPAAGDAAAVDHPEVAAARSLIDAIDKGGVPLNPAKLRAVAEGLGLDVRPDARPEETIARIRAAADRATSPDSTRIPPGIDTAAPAKPEVFPTKPEANMAGLKEDATAVPAEGGWSLRLNTRPYSEREKISVMPDLARLNEGLKVDAAARSTTELHDAAPAELLKSAPTPAMVVGRRIARLLGVKVVFVEDHVGFDGVSLKGVAYVSPQLKHPELAITGHEVLHSILQQMRASDPARAQALHEQVAAYLRPEAVDKKQAAEPDRSRRHAEEEVIADLNGSMWLDPKFWAEMRKADPSTFRKVAYAFMQAVSHAAKGLTRFQASSFTHDVDAVRKILARELSQVAREEGVESHSPTEKQELGVKEKAEAKPEDARPAFATKDKDGNVEEYGMDHRPPGPDGGAPLHDLTGKEHGIYPDDFYGPRGAEYYGHYGQNHPIDRETMQILAGLRGKPDAPVKIYRAVPKVESEAEELHRLEGETAKYLARRVVPKGVTEKGWYDKASERRDELRAKRDAGTLSDEAPMTAINRGDWVTVNRKYAVEHGQRLDEGARILSKTVKAREVYTNGDSIHEAGYWPEEAAKPDFSRKDDKPAAKAGPTDTPEFRRWFAGSRVVDAGGEPLVVYHGTGKDFSKFSASRTGTNWRSTRYGFYFTDSPDEATHHAERSAGRNRSGGGAAIMPVYLSIKNPLMVQAKPEMGAVSYFDVNQDAILSRQREGGHDGVIVDDGKERMYVALSPEQIKSATGNNGQFDPANPDIRFSHKEKPEAKPVTVTREQARELGDLRKKADPITKADVDALEAEVRAKHGIHTLDLHLDSRTGAVRLDTIATQRTGTGAGTAAMRDIVEWADKHGVRLTLSLAEKGYQPIERGPKTSSPDRLREFYKRFDFVDNKGRRKDYTLNDSMYREPQGRPDFSRKEEPAPSVRPGTVTREQARELGDLRKKAKILESLRGCLG